MKLSTQTHNSSPTKLINCFTIRTILICYISNHISMNIPKTMHFCSCIWFAVQESNKDRWNDTTPVFFLFCILSILCWLWPKYLGFGDWGWMMTPEMASCLVWEAEMMDDLHRIQIQMTAGTKASQYICHRFLVLNKHSIFFLSLHITLYCS